MCLTNNSAKLCGTLLSFYEAKPKKQRGFRWCLRTRAAILSALHADRILPSDTDRLPIPRLRAECNILADDPAWAFVLPYFDKLVHHYATKWVMEPGNGALVSWSAVSGCYQWDERQTAGWAAGGVEVVEAWMRQTLGKTDWWQGEQPGLVEQLGSMSLQAPPNLENVPPPVNDLSSRVNDPAPAPVPVPVPETPNAWASLEHDCTFNPWSASEAGLDPVAGPLPPVVPIPAGPAPSPQPAVAPAARLAETGTVVSAPFSTAGTNTVISAPASTPYAAPQTPRTPRTPPRDSSTVFSSPFSTAGTDTVISSPASTVFTPTPCTIGTSTVISSPQSSILSSPGQSHAPRNGNSTVISSPFGTTVVSSRRLAATSRRPSAEYHQPSEAFTQALEMHRTAQQLMVEAEMAMKEYGLFGYQCSVE